MKMLSVARVDLPLRFLAAAVPCDSLAMSQGSEVSSVRVGANICFYRYFMVSTFFVEFIHSVEDKFFAFETGPILPLQWLCSKRQWLIFLPKD